MEQLLHTARQFETRGIRTRVFSSTAEVSASILAEIEPDLTVALGGSVTLQELNVYETLKSRGQKVLWHWKVPKEEAALLRRNALDADVYITSSNAVIEDGRLLNIDGTGNRVAAMIFGPPRVIVIAGHNKLAPDYTTALERIHTIACPKNAERLNRNVPCRYTGKCQDCRSADRMCQYTVMIDNHPEGRTVEVWLVNEELGY